MGFMAVLVLLVLVFWVFPDHLITSILLPAVSVRSLSPRPSGPPHASPTAHTHIAMAFWGLEIKPGKNPTPLNLERRLVIKQAALSVSKSSPEPVVLSVRAHSCRLQ